MLFIDDREVTAHPEIPDVIGVEYSVLRLPAADYVFFDWSNSSSVGIERSAIGNFVQKLRSGELEEQMAGCISMYQSVILLIEDVYDANDEVLATYKHSKKGYFRNYIYTHTYYDAIQSAIVDISRMGVEVLTTPNFDCTMRTVNIIYHNRTKQPSEHALFSKIRKPIMPVKMSANPAVPRLMALCPRIPEHVAIALVYKYDTIWNIVHQEDKELMETEGMGKGLVKNLREAIGKSDKYVVMEHMD